MAGDGAVTATSRRGKKGASRSTSSPSCPRAPQPPPGAPPPVAPPSAAPPQVGFRLPLKPPAAPSIEGFWPRSASSSGAGHSPQGNQSPNMCVNPDSIFDDFIAEDDILDDLLDESMVFLKASMEALQEEADDHRLCRRKYIRRPQEQCSQLLEDNYFSVSPFPRLTSAQMDASKKSACTAVDLTDDIIVEILSRLPVKSICRFKCVSWHWYGLITHSEHRKKIPRTLSGFFYPGDRLNPEENDIVMFSDFVDITGREELPFSDPSLPFLTGYRLIIPKTCCNGLLLCLCWKVSPRDEANYVVCNPATEKWFVLPKSDYNNDACPYRLGFDPAASSHFCVFQILEEDEDYGFIAGVNIYSSETGAWSHKGNGWGNELQVVDSRGVFFKGMLHLMTNCFKILAVDTQGKIWRTIPLLETMCAENFGRNLLSSNLTFIGQSRGQLYYINMRERDLSILSVWILVDYDSGEWIFKYSISTSQLFGKKGLNFEQDYALIAIHPECNLIYFVWKCKNILMSYDMERGKVCVICNVERLYGAFLPYLSYVPFLSGSARLEA